MLLFLGGANGAIDTAEIAVSADDLVGFRRYGTAGNYLKEDKGFRRRSPDVHNSGAKRQREIVRMQRAKGEEVAGERLKQGKRQSGDNRRQHGCQGPVRPPQGGEQRSAKGTVNQDQADDRDHQGEEGERSHFAFRHVRSIRQHKDDGDERKRQGTLQYAPGDQRA